MQTIWGFDLGVASIGFAVVRWNGGIDDAGRGEIERLGVRVFPETREGRKHEPKNVPRRQKRLARRQTHRRRWRRVELRRVLAAASLLPSPQAIPPCRKHDPYALRAKGLSEPLTAEELGWALFHLLKRRGWQGSRKHPGERNEAQQTKEDKAREEEEKESEEKRERLKALLSDGKKLATALVGIESSIEKAQRRRDIGQTRAMVLDEFDALWAKQGEYHPEVLTETLRESIESTALWQRPTFFRRRTIGRCSLEPAEERALKADWLTQQFETLQLVNGLRLAGGNLRELDAEEREKALAYLESAQEPTWAELRDALWGREGRKQKFTHEAGKKETVRGNATEARLRAALGGDFPAHPAAEAIRREIGAAWHLVEYNPARWGSIFEIRDGKGVEAERKKLQQRAEREWGLTPDVAERLAGIDLPGGHGMHSREAMEKLLPRLQEGKPYMTAIQAEYGARESGSPVRFLPGANRSELGRITDPFIRAQMESLLAGVHNPSVLRTLNELQKVVNTLLRAPEYGRPDLVRIELARELKQSAVERSKVDNEQRNRERMRKMAREEVTKLGKPAEGKEGEENVLRWLLWKEQAGRSPFPGESISCTEVLDGNATEIEHIYPRSRRPSENAQANKVLCLRGENRTKGTRTPAEWLRSDAENWAYLSKTLWPEMVKAGWPKEKRDRFLRENLDDPESSEFSERQLRDTSFIATRAREYLGLLFGGGQEGLGHVQTVAGRATAQLRSRWGLGLNRLLYGEVEGGAKARDDHRHHAIDALVVALAVPAWIKRLSDSWQARETMGVRPPSIGEPWRGLQAAAKVAVEAIVVSHKVQTKVTGPLHEETRLGSIQKCDGHERLFVKRKEVKALTGPEVAGDKQSCIADEGVARAIREQLRARGISNPRAADKGQLSAALAQEFRLPRKDGSPGPVIRRVRLLVRKDVDAVTRVHRTRNIWAEFGAGSLHHLAIYQDGERVWGKAIRIHEAAARARAGEPLIARDGAAGRLVMALHPGDCLSRESNGRPEYRVVRFFYSNGQIFHAPTIRLTDRESARPAPGQRPYCRRVGRRLWSTRSGGCGARRDAPHSGRSLAGAAVPQTPANGHLVRRPAGLARPDR
jgi:CRISPR-associated endonuclease Csn1